jgi:hypothetical protein
MARRVSMKFIITDENKKEVLITSDIKEAYEKIKTLVFDPQNLLSIQKLKNAFNYDISKEKEQSAFGFYANREKTKYMRMDVYYNE